MTIFAPSLGALWKQLEGYGINPRPLFEEEGIDPETLFDQGARVSINKFQRLDLKAAELSNDPFFGLKGAEHFRPTHLGSLGFAWLASSSLRTAFQCLSRYARVINEKLTVDLEEDGRFFYVSIDAQLPMLSERIMEEGQLAILVKICRVIAGKDFKPAKVHFRQAEPVDTGYYYELFRCPIAFKAEHTLFVIDRGEVDKRLTGSNDQLAKLNENIVVKYLAHREKADIVNRAKASIIDKLGCGEVTEILIAESLHMTPRNMHRKLQKEDTSFKVLLTGIRRELAQQYIQDRSKTLTKFPFCWVSRKSAHFQGHTRDGPASRQAKRDRFWRKNPECDLIIN